MTASGSPRSTPLTGRSTSTFPAANPTSEGLCGCRGELGPLARARWNLAVLTELAEPGDMELLPILAEDESVIDFEWSRASPTATWMLGRAGEDLTGRRLRTFFEGDLGERLFEVYKCAVVSGRSEIAKVEVGDLSVMHRVFSKHDGVSVHMTCLSAMERMAAAGVVLLALMSTTGAPRASRVAAPSIARELSWPPPSAEHGSATPSASVR